MASDWPEWPRPDDKISLSWLSYGMFGKCQRSWLYQYANDAIEGEEKWEFVRAKALMPINALAGRVVDDTISIGLLDLHEGKAWPDTMSLSREVFAGYLKFTHEFIKAVTERQRWPKGLFQALDRIYYDERFPAIEKESVLAKVNLCLSNFEKSDILGEIKRYDRSTWQLSQRKVEIPPPWFYYSDFPVYAKYDFAIRTSDAAIIYDWKTGNPVYGEDAAVEQLHWYAHYAISEWAVKPERITLVPVWLSVGSSYYPTCVDSERLERISNNWINRVELLRSIRQAHFGLPEKYVQAFDMTEDLRTCKSCAFRTCPGWRRTRADAADVKPSDEADPLTYE